MKILLTLLLLLTPSFALADTCFSYDKYIDFLKNEFKAQIVGVGTSKRVYNSGVVKKAPALFFKNENGEWLVGDVLEEDGLNLFCPRIGGVDWEFIDEDSG